MLLFCFVVVIVYAWIFCLCFSQKQSANQGKKYRGMLYYLIEKHMQKFRHFWRKNHFTWKSHLRPSCTKPFNYILLGDVLNKTHTKLTTVGHKSCNSHRYVIYLLLFNGHLTIFPISFQWCSSWLAHWVVHLELQDLQPWSISRCHTSPCWAGPCMSERSNKKLVIINQI